MTPNRPQARLDTDHARPTTRGTPKRWRSHWTRPGTASGAARPPDAAKIRGRLKAERRHRRQAEDRLEAGAGGTLARLFRGRGR